MASRPSFRCASAFLFSAINNPVQKSQDLSRIAILRLRDLDPNQARARADRHRDHRPGVPGARDDGVAEVRGDVWRVRRRAQGRRAQGPRRRHLRHAAHVRRAPARPRARRRARRAAVRGSRSSGPSTWRPTRCPRSRTPCRTGARASPGCSPRRCSRGATARGRPSAICSPISSRAASSRRRSPRPSSPIPGSACCCRARSRDIKLGYVLAVPNTSPLVEKLFEGKDWAGGAWKDALRQAPADIVITDRNINRIRIAGVRQRAQPDRAEKLPRCNGAMKARVARVLERNRFDVRAD